MQNSCAAYYKQTHDPKGTVHNPDSTTRVIKNITSVIAIPENGYHKGAKLSVENLILVNKEEHLTSFV